MKQLPVHLRGDGPCQSCGTVDNICWFTASPFWNNVVGGPGCMDDPGGIYCINCFVILADKVGMRPTAWQLVPEWPWRMVKP
jgi:hypothetical protein